MLERTVEQNAARHCIVISCRFTKTLRNVIFPFFFLILFFISFHFISSCNASLLLHLFLNRCDRATIHFDRSNQILFSIINLIGENFTNRTNGEHCR